MKNKNSMIPLSKNTSEDISQEKVIKLILRNLIEKYTLEKIVNDIVAVTKENENNLILKDKIPLNPGDIISIMYKNVGSIKLFQNLLDIYRDDNEIPKINKNDNIEKKEKLENYPSSPPNSSIEEDNPQISTNISTNNNASNNDDIVIEIDSIDDKKNDNIIPLSENEMNVIEIKDGIKSEIKSFSRKRKKNKQIKKANSSIHNNGVSSEIKTTKMQKDFGKNYEKKLGSHYILEKSNFYKFKVENLDKEKKIAIFICEDPNCKAFAEYSIENESFKLLRDHNIPNNKHIYNENIDNRDKNIIDFMKNYNIDDLQLTKE